MRRSLATVRRLAVTQLFFAGVIACGSRTGLFGEDGNDPFFSVTVTGEAGADARVDGGRDAQPDAPPPIDARPPQDVFRDDCPSTKLLVYTITDSNELQSFNPETGTFRSINKIRCPTTETGATPFSMAVDRIGNAYVMFNDERLYFVDVLNPTQACTRLEAYQPRQSNFGLFGMGFSTDQGGPRETLFVAGVDEPYGTHVLGAGGLASISPETFKLTFVNEFNGISKAELTGTGDGRLFAFYKKPDPRTGVTAEGPPSFIGEIDKQTGEVVGERRFDNVDQGNGWAFAFWGGDFYMFHAPNGGRTLVTRWRPSDDSVTQVATSPFTIVGAGVSTCAPQQ